MDNEYLEHWDEKRQKLAVEVEELSDEVKLLSINLAIAVAKVQRKKAPLKSLENDFTELISRITRTTGQVVDVLNAFKNEKALLYSLPASSKIIEQRGAYDKIEASLNFAFNLSQQILNSISLIENRKRLH